MKRQGDDIDRWEKLGKRRRCDTQVTCGVCQSPPEGVKKTLEALSRFIIHKLNTGGYKVASRSVGDKIILLVSDENEPEETLQTPVRIWLSYQKSRVCDEYRVAMKFSFGWYSMVQEYVRVEHSGYWSETYQNGYLYTPPYSRCHTIFNRIKGV